MKFCSNCGGTLEVRVPDGDTLPRHVCPACGAIHYQNPKLIIGSIPAWENKILLCRRAIEPRHGLWTLPAGFMENGETIAQAALRETVEEANANVEIGDLYALYNLPHISQVHLMFRARLLDLSFKPGLETLETKLFTEAEIPWDSLAFRAVRETLKRFFEDRSRGQFGFHIGTIGPPR